MTIIRVTKEWLNKAGRYEIIMVKNKLIALGRLPGKIRAVHYKLAIKEAIAWMRNSTKYSKDMAERDVEMLIELMERTIE